MGQSAGILNPFWGCALEDSLPDTQLGLPAVPCRGIATLASAGVLRWTPKQWTQHNTVGTHHSIMSHLMHTSVRLKMSLHVPLYHHWRTGCKPCSSTGKAPLCLH